MPPFLRLLPLPKSLTTDLPKPLAAGIGLAVTLPGFAFRTALTLPQQILGTYEELARLGSALVSGGRAVDPDDGDEGDDDIAWPEVEGWGERRLRPVDDFSESYAPEPGALEEEALDAIEEEDEPVDDLAEQTLDADAVAADVPPALVGDDAAASLIAAAEDRTETPTDVPSREDLPIDGYDGLSAAALRAHVGPLSVDELERVKAYEQAHAKRLTVLALLERTIAKKQ